jgi:hypothetical protein
MEGTRELERYGMVGILVHGNNHYILSGRRPNEAEALELARHWGLVQIGEPISTAFGQWRIQPKEFRENLKWAVVVPGDRGISDGVSQLLDELRARGIAIQTCSKGCQ